MIAIALSVLFPGLGQFYYGRWGRAVLMMVIAVTPLYPIALVWSIVDAYRLSRQGVKPEFSRKEAVAAILLCAVVVPACVVVLVMTGTRTLSWFRDAYLDRSRTVSEGTEIASTLVQYHSEVGRYPETLSVLVGTRPLRAGWLTDGWGRAYRYRLEQNGDAFHLVSAGRDGQFDTDDDLAWRP